HRRLHRVHRLGVSETAETRSTEALTQDDLITTSRLNDRRPQNLGQSARRALPIVAQSFLGRATIEGAADEQPRLSPWRSAWNRDDISHNQTLSSSRRREEFTNGRNFQLDRQSHSSAKNRVGRIAAT